MCFDRHGIDAEELLACLAGGGRRPHSAQSEIQREREEPLLGVGEGRIARRGLEVGIEAPRRIGHAHAYLVGRGHVAPSQIRHVRLDVRGGPRRGGQIEPEHLRDGGDGVLEGSE